MRKNYKDILIIDPNKNIAENYQLMFKDLDFTVDICSSLSRAVQKMKANWFTCIIMDVDLPEMKGYQAIKIIKMLNSRVKIIVTATQNTRDLETKIREQNIFYYYLKSFEIDELKQAVCNAINKIKKNTLTRKNV